MQSSNRYVLVIRRGPQQGHGYPLDGALATVGRYTGNTIIIPDETISRHHARVRRTDEGHTIEDLQSANGLFINGERINQPQPLKTGDVIRLGEQVELVYEVITVEEMKSPSGQVVPAFDEKPGLVRPVSDTGGTVWMKKVSAPAGRDEPVRKPGPAWLWIAILAAVIIIGAVLYFAVFAGR